MEDVMSSNELILSLSKKGKYSSMLDLQEHGGNLLTQQEILLLQLYDQLYPESDVKHGGMKESSIFDKKVQSNRDRDTTTRIPSKSMDGRPSLTASQADNRLRVQEFLKKKITIGVQRPQSNVDRVKSIAARTPGSSVSMKRLNPLADILGGSKRPFGATHDPVSSVPSARDSSLEGTAFKKEKKDEDKLGTITLPHGRGTIQLPPESFLRTQAWDSAKDEPCSLTLPNVTFNVNNTLIVKATMPLNSSRCCFNLCRKEADGTRSILYHFNPRRQRGGQIIQNSQIEDRWGIIVLFPRFPLTFGAPFYFRLTILPTGFAIFIDEVFQTEYYHRRPIEEGSDLILHLPTRDDYGSPEGVVVDSVWWGHADTSMIPNQRTSHSHSGRHTINMVDSGTSINSSHLGGEDGGLNSKGRLYDAYVGGISDDVTREDLEKHFGALHCVRVRIMHGKGYGFVSFNTMMDVDDAIRDMNGTSIKGCHLRVSRARHIGSSNP